MRLTGMLALWLALFTLTGCASLVKEFETPEVRLTNLALLEAGLLEQRYVATMRVKNPNRLKMPIGGISYAFSLAGAEVATGSTLNPFSVPAGGEADFDIEVRTNLMDTVQRLRDWLQGSPTSLDYSVSGEIDVDLPFVRAVPFSDAGTIPLLPPQ